MLDSMFRGLFDTDSASVISLSDFLLCILCSLIIGLLLAFAYSFRTRAQKALL